MSSNISSVLSCPHSAVRSEGWADRAAAQGADEGGGRKNGLRGRGKGPDNLFEFLLRAQKFLATALLVRTMSSRFASNDVSKHTLHSP
jgi:hypothetical protein